MALHSDLPIYKVAYELLQLAIAMSRNMPRDVKQLVGAEICQQCVQITALIFRANVARDKAPHLLDVIERVQAAELMIRMSRDLRLIGTKQYAAAIALTAQIGKQANGWRRASASPAT